MESVGVFPAKRGDPQLPRQIGQGNHGDPADDDVFHRHLALDHAAWAHAGGLANITGCARPVASVAGSRRSICMGAPDSTASR